MFNGTFNRLDKHQLVALVSCLVPVDKSSEELQLTRNLGGPLKQLQDTAKMIAEVSRECKLDIDTDEYIDSFRPYLMVSCRLCQAALRAPLNFGGRHAALAPMQDVVYAWSKGSSFSEVCKMTDIFEGSIIRATRRLDELLNQLQMAAKAVGDTDLARKFEEGQETIHRDIMFAASLYI